MFHISIRPADDPDKPFVRLGEVAGMILTMADGRKLRLGDRASIFDTECTDKDKKLLQDMRIKI